MKTFSNPPFFPLSSADFLSQAQAFFDTISPENLRRDAARAIRAGHIECMTSDTDSFVDTNGLKRVRKMTENTLRRKAWNQKEIYRTK